MPLLVRPAAPAEFDAIGALTADVYAAEALAGPAYVATLRDARSRAEAPLTELLLAGDTAVHAPLRGAVTFCLQGSPWAMDARQDEAEIRMVVVPPAARRSGVGEALVGACIERARAAGAIRLVRLLAYALELWPLDSSSGSPSRASTPLSAS